jgi:tagaturonate reductase
MCRSRGVTELHMSEKTIIMQYGEGNFLRAFCDYMIDAAKGKDHFNPEIVIVKPIRFGDVKKFKEADNRYNVVLRGLENGEKREIYREITSVSDVLDIYGSDIDLTKYNALAENENLKFIISNTTEAGIVFDETDTFETEPAATFPGKLTKFLYKRYTYFKGDMTAGVTVLPVELIDNNGAELLRCIIEYAKLWNLGDDFESFIVSGCNFTSTLVDRIVTGYPKDEKTLSEMSQKIGYDDKLLVTAEIFGLWVIESNKDFSESFPLKAAGMPVLFTDNLKPYKERKVRILNGAHTSMFSVAFLMGERFVRQSVENESIWRFTKTLIDDEIIPTLSLDEEDLKKFAADVTERFKNPFIDHELFSISLNSVSKFRARCLPSIKGYIEKYGKLPKLFTFSLASLIQFYLTVDGVRDDENVLDFFREAHSDITADFLEKAEFFGEDIRIIGGLDFAEAVRENLLKIQNVGAKKALDELFIGAK